MSDHQSPPKPSQVFIKMLLEAIIYGRNNGIPMSVMESGFQHAWLHAELLGLKEVPLIPSEPRHVSHWGRTAMTTVNRHTILREYVSDRVKAHRLNAHRRCYIDTRRGGKLVSCFSPGVTPGARAIREGMRQEQRNQRTALAMHDALRTIGAEVTALYQDGIIGHELVTRILGEANQILQENAK